MAEMTPRMAKEHVADASDNVSCCIKSLKRVAKSYPDLSPTIDSVLNSLDGSLAVIKDLKAKFEVIADKN